MSKIRAAAEMMGRILPGRSQNISQQVLGNPGRRQEMMGRSIPGRGLAGSLRPVPGDISKAQALGMTTAMGGLGGLGVADLTEGFTETANIKNSIFSNPEELGRQAARAKMTLQEIMDRARGKAEELGEAPQIHMLKVQSGYQDEMNNQQMQEPQRIYDEDQGMKPVSLFMNDGGEASVQEYIKMLKNKMDVSEAALRTARQGRGPNLSAINIPTKKIVQLNKEYLNAKDEYQRAIRSLTKGNIKEYESKGSIGQFFSPMSMTPAMAPGEIKKFIEYKETQGMADGGEASFPDLTGDGQVTQADILKGRGVEFAEGGEAIGDDLAGMAMSQEEAMAEVGNAEKEMAMIQQLVTVVQQLLAEGISEDDLVAFLKEQGLDDEDIDSLMQMVLQSQSTQAPDQIGQELQGMM